MWAGVLPVNNRRHSRLPVGATSARLVRLANFLGSFWVRLAIFWVSVGSYEANLASIWVRFGFVFSRTSIMTGIVWLRFSRKIFFEPRMDTNGHEWGKNQSLESKFPAGWEFGGSLQIQIPDFGNLTRLTLFDGVFLSGCLMRYGKDSHPASRRYCG
jgi:hypothetical protein